MKPFLAFIMAVACLLLAVWSVSIDSPVGAVLGAASSGAWAVMAFWLAAERGA
jgi:hypothetical protein